MGMGRKTGVGRNPNQRCGPCNFITDPVQHAPLDTSGGRRYPFPVFWADQITTRSSNSAFTRIGSPLVWARFQKAQEKFKDTFQRPVG